MHSPAFDKLCEQIARLKHQATQFDQSNLFAKNRYMQAQPSLFDRGVFTTKSMKLADYVSEIEDELKSLPPAEHRHAYQYALERITQQVQAVFNVIKSTPVWAKENKYSFKPKTKPQVYKQAVQKMMQSSHELYDELKQNHEFERRLVLMIEERKLKLDAASAAKAAEINQEILALHARLGRCRKAISATEDKIQQVEKQQLR
ncbi:MULTISPECIES: primosomal replication protein [Pseudoalteromonas]|jgi:primosomal replication protein N''|uniref:Restart primosome assembly protein PriC n=1 Tax=Pseudoalteromonas lipolytica TaxID=570156 RepID=A0ABY1GY35_9GAMM|nr:MULTISPECIES: primosomal replication protein [Pseudoalteromonas]EWH06746.1 primosomal protein [Pseudoalteromonas lipolytica SCSIO 04301]MBE0351291.1 primosomal replication protein N'' [Pseudoalteromonas lipolytica LMEB 39]MCC9660942.1 primosomal replication protein [Pseudoalteromonas sp. MB41]QMW15617.1 primosomal replication protein [Pseudoalteromonas sp. MT33b]QPL44000.1 primosomal replication protein [Pseudoalteromonas sp. A41-2]|tara:strand:- start:2293 stop:2901 length:609 start_codon:yes stop_codon:yes gene_type:complete